MNDLRSDDVVILADSPFGWSGLPFTEDGLDQLLLAPSLLKDPSAQVRNLRPELVPLLRAPWLPLWPLKDGVAAVMARSLLDLQQHAAGVIAAAEQRLLNGGTADVPYPQEGIEADAAFRVLLGNWRDSGRLAAGLYLFEDRQAGVTELYLLDLRAGVPVRFSPLLSSGERIGQLEVYWLAPEVWS